MWTKIEGYENYSVSKFGSVRNDRNKRILKQHINGSGYKRVCLSKNGVYKWKFVHKLVYLNFIGPIPEDMVIDHIDEDKLNNKVYNLQVLSKGDNIKKGKRKFRNRPYTRFKDEFKREIQQHIEDGKSIKWIPDNYPISWQWVQKLKRDNKWVKYGTGV